jgi:hypothetical protein
MHKFLEVETVEPLSVDQHNIKGNCSIPEKGREMRT